MTKLQTDMRTCINAAGLIPISSVLIPCSHAADSTQTSYTNGLAVAEKAAAELMATMKSELRAALQTGDTSEAIAICSARAQALSAEIPRRIGRPDITIHRTSLRFRNPANRPTHQEKLVLQQFAEQLKEGKPLKPLTQTTEKVLRYYQPLQAAPLCLGCHGTPEQISPHVHALLRRYYPEDKATGFAEGDLRGMISITVPADSK